MAKKDSLKIYNGFGITPTKKGKAAGWDFYIPNIHRDPTDVELRDAFLTTYKVTENGFEEIWNTLSLQVSSVYGEEKFEGNEWNILLLFLSLTTLSGLAEDTIEDKVNVFVDNNLIFDANGIPGIRCTYSDKLFVNIGIRPLLKPGTIGIYENKSGVASRGWDLGACVVDEDYRGWLCVNMFYRGWGDSAFYCGDKLTQMLIIKNESSDVVDELTIDDYWNLGDGSERGSDGFGSSDIIH